MKVDLLNHPANQRRLAAQLILVLVLLLAGCTAPGLTPAPLVEITPQPTQPQQVQNSPSSTAPAVSTAENAPDLTATTAPAQTELSCTAPAEVTPPLTEGPFYTPGSPQRTNLIEEGMPGERIIIRGYVLDRNCQPVSNVWLDFWQADANGAYDNAGYTLRGQQYSDAQGRFVLETVLPGEYPGRTPHIHVKVQPPGGDMLTTQLFFPGAAGNETDRIFDQCLLVVVRSSAEGYEGDFNFIVP